MTFKQIVIGFAFSVACGPLAYAQTASAINNTGINEAVSSGVNGNYGAVNASNCGRSCRSCCIRAVAGYAQMAVSLMTMLQNMQSRDALSSADWSRIVNVPDYDPTTGVNPGYLDPVADAVRNGSYVAYENAAATMLRTAAPDIKKLADMGYTFDPKTGEITLPPGVTNTGGVDSSNAEFASLMDQYNKVLSSGTLDSSGGGGLIMADSKTAGGARALSSNEFNSSAGSVDGFLNKLDKGQLDSNKLVGMSKLTKNGDAIGVPMGNLFQTIHYKYRNLDTQKEFK